MHGLLTLSRYRKKKAPPPRREEEGGRRGEENTNKQKTVAVFAERADSLRCLRMLMDRMCLTEQGEHPSAPRLVNVRDESEIKMA